MMKKILSRVFNILKYVLLIGAFILVFLGIVYTYRRLEKSLVEAIPVFLPFALLFIAFIVNIFIKRSTIKDNLLFNFTVCLVLIAIIVIGLRALLDKNMLLYFKYKINYNPLYLSDNLSTIEVMLYCLFGADILFLISDILSKPKPEKIKIKIFEKIKTKKDKKEDKKEIIEVPEIIVEISDEENVSFDKKEEIVAEELILEPVTEVKVEAPVVVEEIKPEETVEKNNEEAILVEKPIETPVEEEIIVIEPETIKQEAEELVVKEKEEVSIAEDPAITKEQEEQKKLEKEKYKSLMKKYNIEETAVHENLVEKLRKQSKK